MKRYAVKVLNEGKYKFYYILDNETYDVVLYPSKFLKHKIDANRSPNTVRRMAFALCYYMPMYGMDTGVSDKNANLQTHTDTNGFIQADESLHCKIQPKG